MPGQARNIWKIVRRVLVILSLLLLLAILILAGVIGYGSLTEPDSSQWANVTYPGPNGVMLHGYLAEPEAEGPHPAVLMIHEWWGLTPGIVALAEALAAEGYAVLAADAYRGEATSLVPRALFLRLTTPAEQIFADVDAALAHLRALPSVDHTRVASMGFCFGGGQSLQLGLRQPENLTLTIIYYGALVTAPERLEPLRQASPVLGIFAEEDQQIFVEDVLEFEANLNTLDIENEITIYPGVGHAFLNEENFDQPSTAGGMAWLQTLDFLQRNLGDS